MKQSPLKNRQFAEEKKLFNYSHYDRHFSPFIFNCTYLQLNGHDFILPCNDHRFRCCIAFFQSEFNKQHKLKQWTCMLDSSITINNFYFIIQLIGAVSSAACLSCILSLGLWHNVCGRAHACECEREHFYMHFSWPLDKLFSLLSLLFYFCFHSFARIHFFYFFLFCYQEHIIYHKKHTLNTVP